MNTLHTDPNDKGDLGDMKAFMLACLNFFIQKYKMFENVILITATFLDPELKSFEFVGNQTDKSPFEFILIATDYLLTKHKTFDVDDVETSENIGKDTTSNKVIIDNSNNAATVEQELFQFLRPNIGSSVKKSYKQTIDDEIKIYRSLKIEKSDFSSFWSNNGLKLPKLKQLVKFVCCGPATSVPSERDFNMGTDIITPKRNKISDKNVEYLTFLKRNLESSFT